MSIVLVAVTIPATRAGATGLRITLDRVTPTSLTVNDSFSVDVTIHNMEEDGEIRNIRLLNASVGNVTLAEQYIARVEPGKSEKASLFGTVDAEGTHVIRVIAVYDGKTVESDSVYIRAVSPASGQPPASPDGPLLIVTGVSFLPQSPNPEEPFTIEIQLVNKGSADARHTVISLDGGNNFEVLDLTNKVVLDTVGNGSRRTASFRIRAKKGRESNLVDIQLAYYSGDRKETQAEKLNLPLGDVYRQASEPPFLKIEGFNIVPQEENGNFLLSFHLKNLGQTEAREIVVRIDPSQAFPRGSSNLVYLPRLAAGASRELSFKMGIVSRDRNVYSIPLSFTYAGGDGTEYSGEETLTVTGRALGLSGEPSLVAGKPRVMLSKYTLSDEQVLAGNTVTLTLHIENSSTREVGNIKVSLSVRQTGGTNTSDAVFSPVNSSNSFYIEKIPAKKTVVRSVDLYVDPNATAKTYSVDVDIEYEDSAGNAYNVTEMVNIPVTQESRLQVLAVEVPPFGGVGQPIPVSAEFVNTGKVALKNFLVSIEGDFARENATYFLASLEIGQSDYFQGMIIPKQEGLLEGKVIFTYTDNTNKEVRIERPFEVNIQQVEWGNPGEPFPPDQPPVTGRPGAGRLQNYLAWLLPSLVVFVGGMFLLIRKIRAGRGEMFDEEL